MKCKIHCEFCKYKGPGEALKRYRKQNGLTQQELADKAKIARTNLVNMESGTRSVGREVARRLAKVLGVADYRLLM